MNQVRLANSLSFLEMRKMTPRSISLADGLPDFTHEILDVAPVMLVDLNVRGVAVSFWEDETLFSRMGFQDISARQIVFGKETETQVSIGWADVTISDRCVLARKDDENETRALLSITYRSYDLDHPKSSLQYSSCICGNLSSLDYVYFQQDLTSFIRYGHL